jgi:hypothetical protein
MVMWFGKKFINKGKSEGQLGVDSAKIAHEQIQKISPAIQIGLCGCLGRNGPINEFFRYEDAKTIKAFADQTPWVCSLHYWSINDDAGNHPRKWASAGNADGQQDTKVPRAWDFANLFKDFTTR